MANLSQETMKKLMAALEFGNSQLKNPQDLAYWPSKNALAIADDSNGLIIFSLESQHQVLKHLKQCADAGSVAYNPVSKQLVVSVAKAISQGDDTPAELQFYDDNFKLVRTIQIPQEPKIKYGYVRWVACDPLDGDAWVASGDNETAALWRYSQKQDKWTTVWKGKGDLEHLCFLPVTDARATKLELIVIRWTEQDNWTIGRWAIDRAKSQVISEKRVEYKADEISEPWSAAVNQEDGTVYTYDYKSGAIRPLAPPDYKLVGEVVGMTKAGQWTSMEIQGAYVYTLSSDERCIRGFITRRH